ncbi:MAG: DUF3857 and transglutaminase domain-containing protein [Bacteroidia bacterium]|nr:DUF3857 and transglutaminase domain-containing protein [Bacteroidia bacterium]
MKQLIACYAFLLLSASFASSAIAANEYPAHTIPESLRKNAHAVVRQDKRDITIRQEDRATLIVTRAVTILDAEGSENAVMVLFYDKLIRIKSAQIRLLDASGKELQLVKSKDMVDRSAHGGNFSTDDRLLYWDFGYRNFPYTVVMDYELDLRNLFCIPDWTVQDQENLSVEQASFSVNMPAEQNLRYAGVKLPAEPIVSTQADRKTYLWELRQVAAVEDEVLSPSWQELVPTLFLIPELFEADGVIGKSDSWASLSQFFYELNDGRQELPKDLKEEIRTLTAGVEDDVEKVRILYEMMQKRTRYVSIQFGIGGWQTFDAAYVHENGFGDCKALTNFMKSMLREVGIESYAALVRAGSRAVPVMETFPSNQFDHVILCVPMPQDTIWLECTSQTQPFGYLGDFTEDRHVLLMAPGGGALIRTPSSSAEMNRRARKAEVFLQPDGSATVTVEVDASGSQQNDLRVLDQEYTRQVQEKYVQRQIVIGSYDLVDFQLSPGPADPTPSYHLSYSLKARNVASVMGKRLFLSPNLLESSWPTLEDKERKYAIDLPESFLDTDTVTIHLPEGFMIEAMPGNYEEETIFGTYQCQLVMIDPTTVLFTRTLTMEKMRLPASYYQELRKFLSDVHKGDHQKMVLNNRS